MIKMSLFKSCVALAQRVWRSVQKKRARFVAASVTIIAINPPCCDRLDHAIVFEYALVPSRACRKSAAASDKDTIVSEEPKLIMLSMRSHAEGVIMAPTAHVLASRERKSKASRGSIAATA